tara:strand:+ start:7601 stop:9436 length:1836 start_codon:yes stop_codon:yes gene_type:complete
MNIRQIVDKLSKLNKKIILLLNDLIIAVLATYIAISLRIDTLNIDIVFYQNAFFIFPPLAVIILFYLGVYNIVLRFSSEKDLQLIFFAIFIYSICIGMIFILIDLSPVPRSLVFIQPIIFFVGITLSRALISYILRIDKKGSKEIICLLYGAGQAGAETLNSLKRSSKYQVMGFIDDRSDQQNRKIDGVKIYSFQESLKLIERRVIDEVILTMPHIKKSRRQEIINILSKYRLRVRSIPSVDDLISGNKNISEIHNLEINDFLNRTINFHSEKVSKFYQNKIVMVTGAGGSIGSELCRQIVSHSPLRIILLDHSELNLFNIFNELIHKTNVTEIVPILTSVNKIQRLEIIFSKYKPEYVLHAAAYKHVHLVEENIIDGVENNIFGTINIIDLSFKYNVSKFCLISTDKAVDPENIMGKTKRIGELYLKHKSRDGSKKIETHVVRFGNVLGSSGSVFRIFSEQIKNGGPVLLTHKDVTRYFMTIPEAVGLILFSSTFKSFGKIYILDMGDPVKIYDLAKKMISLSGYSLKDDKNEYGDIEIKIIGLKKGEKLHEKLAYSDNLLSTTNKHILEAKEDGEIDHNFKKDIDELKSILLQGDEISVREQIEKFKII